MGILDYLYIFLGCLTYLTWAAEDTWTAQIKAYKPKTLRSDRIRKVASWSQDKSAKDYFKNNLLEPILQTRVSGSTGNLEVQQHIKSFMSSFGWGLEEDSFEDKTPFGNKTFTNIIATQNPAAPRKLVIACHFDSKYFLDFTFIGATDSAVPCAMMLDLAKLMNSTLWENNPRKTYDVSLQFIFFDGEEAFVRWSDTDSLYGSRHLANKMLNRQVNVGREEFQPEIKTIDVMILLDLIGTSTTTFESWFTETDKLFQRFQKIETKLVKEGLIKYSAGSSKYFKDSTYRGRGGGIEDDHKPFLDKGVRILHLISYPFPREWHKESDNKKALDYNTINNIGQIIRVFVAEYLHLTP